MGAAIARQAALAWLGVSRADEARRSGCRPRATLHMGFVLDDEGTEGLNIQFLPAEVQFDDYMS